MKGGVSAAKREELHQKTGRKVEPDDWPAQVEQPFRISSFIPCQGGSSGGNQKKKKKKNQERTPLPALPETGKQIRQKPKKEKSVSTKYTKARGTTRGNKTS